MVLQLYKEALAKLMEKPLRLWGISLLYLVLCGVTELLFGIIPGLCLAILLLLETSMTMIFLHGYRGEQVEALQLFDCFRDWNTAKRVLGGMAWMAMWIFLWGLIPFVGPIFAVIRIYEYRLTPYILMLEPEVKATDAIKLSKERTMGWKSKMFWADVLVFVLAFAAMLILGILATIPYIGSIFGFALTLVWLVYVLFVTLFIGLVRSSFYEKICPRVEPSAPFEPAEPAPEEAEAAAPETVIAELPEKTEQ